MKDKEYVLGAEQRELERLHFQHKVWTEPLYAMLRRGDVRAGQTVLDLGCGPGFTTYELAQVVGPTGVVFARDQSSAFLAFLRNERERRGLVQIEVSEGPVETLELKHGSIDRVYARWLFCWLVDPRAALRRVAEFVRPGGAILVQDYIDWAAMRIVPREPAFDRAVEACMQSWLAARATIDIAERIPALAAEAGLEVEQFRPLSRSGRVGSLEWRWISTFFETYLPKTVASGLLTQREMQACLEALAPHGAADARWCVTPTMTDIVLRKP
jgi:SAM-dependent methyltransferase